MPRGHAKEHAKNFEEYPLSRQEYISAMVHLYRGELGRANNWRLRLDNTTNWAVISTMGLLSFAFGRSDQSHASILMGMILVMHYLTLEARRYRFFDVWRNRVRMVEENFYAPILARYLHSPERNWGDLVADDLLRPRFKITYLQAVRARIVANYGVLFVVLLVSWFAKILMFSHHSELVWYQRMAIGQVPWYVVGGVVAVIYIYLSLVFLFVPMVRAPEKHFWSSHNPLGQIHDF